MGKFIVELHDNGVVRKSWTVAARRAAIVGVLDGKWPYLPDNESVVSELPYQYRKAYGRCFTWWQAQSGLCDVLRCDLYSARDGAPMGSIFARYSKQGEK